MFKAYCVNKDRVHKRKTISKCMFYFHDVLFGGKISNLTFFFKKKTCPIDWVACVMWKKVMWSMILSLLGHISYRRSSGANRSEKFISALILLASILGTICFQQFLR